MRQGASPEYQGADVVRTDDIVTLLDQVTIDTTTERISDPLQVGAFRHFAVYLRLKSAGVGSQIIQLIPQFLEPRSRVWHDHRQGIFASLYFEDTVHTTERSYVFLGDNLGRELRFRLAGTNTDNTYYFTASVAVELYN